MGLGEKNKKKQEINKLKKLFYFVFLKIAKK
jgi:hypothetical protein